MRDRDAFMKSGLIESYVLGLCSPEERQTVEEFIDSDAEIAKIVKENTHAMEQYCREVRRKTPSHVREKILHAIDAEQVTQRPKHSKMQPLWSRLGPVAAAVALFALIAAGLLGRKNSQLTAQLNSKNQDLIAVEENLEELQMSHSLVINQMTFLQDVNTSHITLQRSQTDEQPIAVIYWNANKQEAVMRAINFPDPPAGMTYQMWADVEGEMKNMGVIKDAKASWISLPYMPHAESLNITLEKEGGSKEPSVDRLVCSAPIRI